MTVEEIDKAIKCCDDPDGCNCMCPLHKSLENGMNCDVVFGRHIGKYIQWKVNQATKETAKNVLDDIWCEINGYIDEDTLEEIFGKWYNFYGVKEDD